MVCLSGCISVPGKNTEAAQGSVVGTTLTGTQAGDGSGPTPSASPAPGEAGYLTPATPFPTATTPASISAGTRLPDATPVPVKYVAIYYDTITPKNNRTAYTYELYRPPLVIELCFSPNMTSRTIWYESDYGQHEEKTETVTSISPYAWFKVTVRGSGIRRGDRRGRILPGGQCGTGERSDHQISREVPDRVLRKRAVRRDPGECARGRKSRGFTFKRYVLRLSPGHEDLRVTGSPCLLIC